MAKKKTIIYISIIIFLTLILGLFWFLIISDGKSSNNSNGSKNNQHSSRSNSSITYTSPKEITKDEEITEGTYESSNADENAILASGNIKTTLSNIKIEKTGDSDGGDNTSFYGNNSAIIASSVNTVTLFV